MPAVINHNLSQVYEHQLLRHEWGRSLRHFRFLSLFSASVSSDDSRSLSALCVSWCHKEPRRRHLILLIVSDAASNEPPCTDVTPLACHSNAPWRAVVQSPPTWFGFCFFLSFFFFSQELLTPVGCLTFPRHDQDDGRTGPLPLMDTWLEDCWHMPRKRRLSHLLHFVQLFVLTRTQTKQRERWFPRWSLRISASVLSPTPDRLIVTSALELQVQR